jgi:hypothetical protein
MRGGKRTGAGRKPGAVSKAKRDLAEMAKGHAPAALRTLVAIAAKGESESARVSAATAILDRGYGKPMQSNVHSGDPDNPLIPESSTDVREIAKAILVILGTAKVG